MYKNLVDLIKSKKAIVSVIGLGYVGLPLALEIARGGFKIYGIDIDSVKVSNLKKSKSYIDDINDKDILTAIHSRLFIPVDNYEPIKESDIIIICLPTPLNKNKQPDLSCVQKAAEEISKKIKEGQLIILKSTTYPGTTEEVVLPVLQKKDFRVGINFFLAFSPERIDPGNKEFKTKNTPKIVGGVTKRCTDLAKMFFGSFIDSIVPVSSAKAAEMTKLLENIFRLVNISMINEIALLCDRMGIDIWEVIEAAKTKPYGFMPFYPGPGIGGHCIPVDPAYLSWKAHEYDFSTRFIDLAAEINDFMPQHTVNLIARALNKNNKSINGSKILLLGVSYKKNIKDTRESPTFPIFKQLINEGGKVIFSDPFINNIDIGGKTIKSKKITDKLLKEMDCVVVVTNHSCWNYEDIAKKSKLIVDTRNAVSNKKFKNIIKL